MKRYILIHYGELGLKKENIGYFIEKLRKRLRLILQKAFKRDLSIIHTLGRIMIDLPDDFNEVDEAAYVKIISKVFGIKNFKFVFVGSIKLDELGEQIWEQMPKYVLDPALKPKTFKVEVKRSMKLPLKSFEIERDLGAVLFDKGLDIKVKLSAPEFTIDVEFFNEHSYFSFKKYPGTGGLPSNSQGKLISLISSGIDSPVASYMMMKRGARVIFVHFYGYPFTDKDEMEHVKELVGMLSNYQFDTKLYLVPFGQIQRDIATNLDIPAKIRTVLYRRLMLQIAERIAKNEQAKGLITGDNFGQVASQTPENIFAIHDATTIPVFQPLIGFDKEDIIKVAEKIGTFEVSKLPCKDTCSMFMPKHPELKANVFDVRNFEKALPVDEWLEKSLASSEIIDFS